MGEFLGVLGGMGPLATADFLKKLVQLTPAANDQEHIPVLLYGDCRTPDRSSHIAGHGPTPLPALLAGIRHLNDAGVGAICIPCNSAHCWYEDMAAASAAPLFHIVRASAAQARQKNPAARRVGVLSTLGTQRMGIYRSALEALDFEVLEPSPAEFDAFVTPGIGLVKANRVSEAEREFRKAASALFERGAEVIILGCTEIPLGMQAQYAEQPARFVDSNEALALAVVAHFSHAR